MVIEITRPINDLEEHRWWFYVHENRNAIQVTLHYYKHMKRATKRHKFIAGSIFDFMYQRHSSGNMKRENVPMPDDVVQELKEKIASSIVFV